MYQLRGDFSKVLWVPRLVLTRVKVGKGSRHVFENSEDIGFSKRDISIRDALPTVHVFNGVGSGSGSPSCSTEEVHKRGLLIFFRRSLLIKSHNEIACLRGRGSVVIATFNGVADGGFLTC